MFSSSLFVFRQRGFSSLSSKWNISKQKLFFQSSAPFSPSPSSFSPSPSSFSPSPPSFSPSSPPSFSSLSSPSFSSFPSLPLSPLSPLSPPSLSPLSLPLSPSPSPSLPLSLFSSSSSLSSSSSSLSSSKWINHKVPKTNEKLWDKYHSLDCQFNSVDLTQLMSEQRKGDDLENSQVVQQISQKICGAPTDKNIIEALSSLFQIYAGASSPSPSSSSSSSPLMTYSDFILLLLEKEKTWDSNSDYVKTNSQILKDSIISNTETTLREQFKCPPLPPNSPPNSPPSPYESFIQTTVKQISTVSSRCIDEFYPQVKGVRDSFYSNWFGGSIEGEKTLREAFDILLGKQVSPSSPFSSSLFVEGEEGGNEGIESKEEEEKELKETGEGEKERGEGEEEEGGVGVEQFIARFPMAAAMGVSAPFMSSPQYQAFQNNLTNQLKKKLGG